MRYMHCRVRDSENPNEPDRRVVIDLQKVVSAEEVKPEGGSLRTYSKIYTVDGRMHIITHAFEEVFKALQSYELGL
jgi:hypothetical protein